MIDMMSSYMDRDLAFFLLKVLKSAIINLGSMHQRFKYEKYKERADK